MLNSKKSTRNVKPSHSGGSPAVNIISEGTRLEGDIQSKTDLRVAGVVEGEARTEGKVIITAQGEVKGNISSEEADIAGRVEGELHISGKLTLRKSAVIDGNLYTKSMVVEEGAEINGMCKMGDRAKVMSTGNNNENRSSETEQVKNVS